MKRLLFVIFLTAVASFAYAQTEVWVNLTKGDALFLNPKTMEWEPITGKQQLPAKTFVLTKGEAELKVFNETDVLATPDQSYFFVADIFPRDKMQIVEELTSIELQQLPSNNKTDSTEQKKVVGLTYGKPLGGAASENAIPYFEERLNAVEWFYNQQRFDAALLTLKRTMTLFPVLFLRPQITGLLCSLYDKLELYGFLYEETNRLMVVQKEGELGSMVTTWNDLAKKKLTKR